MKILFPGGGASTEEIEELLRLAIEGRKRVKDQLMRIDTTYPDTDFSYMPSDRSRIAVTTLEEDEYPTYYHRRGAIGTDSGQVSEGAEACAAGFVIPIWKRGDTATSRPAGSAQGF